MSTDSLFRLRFAVASEERFAALVRAYERIRWSKSADQWSEDVEEWKGYFDAESLRHFWWPTPSEVKDWERRWFATPVSKRFTDPALQHPWDFMSLIDAFKNGDYVLHAIERSSRSEAALPFDPHGFPFGGTDSMRALVEAFGHQVTEMPE